MVGDQKQHQKSVLHSEIFCWLGIHSYGLWYYRQCCTFELVVCGTAFPVHMPLTPSKLEGDRYWTH
jgi:hypothetical protein